MSAPQPPSPPPKPPLPATRAPGPSVFSVPAEASFADALAAELVRRHAHDPLALARGRILLPNARAVRTVTEAFVRASGSGLLLPRLIPVGDPSLDERIGGALEQPGAEPVPPGIDPLTRQAELAGMIQSERRISAAESWRLAGDLARTLDQLIVEEVDLTNLQEIDGGSEELAGHQQRALAQLTLLLDRWPERLRELGRIDLAARRNLLLRQVARRWKAAPPPGFTLAAGITTAAPAIAELLAVVARMPDGAVLLPGLASTRLLPDEQWQALGLEGEEGERPEPTHPQYHLKLLLHRMGVHRSEVEPWPAESSAACRARVPVAASALTAARFSHEWSRLGKAQRRLTGVTLALLPDPASEAQAIALLLREALETPERTAALVTPDRQLARRVASLLRRWSIEADDSAGAPLGQLAPGTLLLGLAAAAAERMAPVALLSLLKHPLVRAGEGRRAWLDDVRALDLALRGPRPPAGLTGAVEALVMSSGHVRDVGKGADPAEDLSGVDRMAAHLCPLALVEAGGLFEDGAGHAELADVVKDGGPAQPAGARRGESDMLRHEKAERTDPLRMACGEGALGIDDLAEGVGNVVEIFLVDDGGGFGWRHAHHPALDQRGGKGEPEVGSGGGGFQRHHQRRVEPLASPPPCFLEARRCTGMTVKDVHHLGQQRDLRSERNGAATKATRAAAAIPMFVEAINAFADGRGKAKGAGDVGAACAARGDELLRDLAAINQDVADGGGASGQRPTVRRLAENKVKRRRKARAHRFVALLKGAVVGFVELADSCGIA